MKKKFCSLLDCKNSLCLLEKACFAFGVLSIPASLFVMFIFGAPDNANVDYNQKMALFIGLWAPTLISIANYLKKR